MKIDDRMIQYEIGKQLPKPVAGETGTADGKQISDGSAPKEGNPSGGDAIVHLSTTYRETQRVKEIIAAEPDVREDKVAEIKAKIDSGNYRIDTEAVAGKLVDDFFEDII